MRRYFIVLGDKTTAGGVVIQAEERFTNHGKPLAYHGAQIYCHACKSTGHICNVPPYRPMTLHGKQIALENDICICKCDPPPRLIASQNNASMSFESRELAGTGHMRQGAQRSKNAQTARRHLKRIYVSDSSTGEPLTNRPFIADVEGREQSGRTDDNGYATIETDGSRSFRIHVIFASPKRNLTYS
ncbi:putative Zn-binding protein involved in type VI secretion [Paraburkholderia sp. WC7.3g]|uniref:PAAR domain-containing protein n=1 Tax=Paraburkholderia podalyriae TaxID=1938811 RepID=A0ABR7PRT1_9BURK|nr:PAAR domain-containing protein [Paraburkholderia podalyriae]